MYAIESYIMLLASIALITAQTLAFKFFNRYFMKNMAVYFFFQILHFAIAALIVFSVNGGMGEARWETITFAVVFACFFVVFFFCYAKAFEHGSLSLSTLFNSFAVLVPVFVSFIFWEEHLRVIQYIGLALLLIVFVLSSRTSTGEAGMEKTSISVKWVLFIVPVVIINGLMMTIQKWHQQIMPGEEIKEFLICVFSFSCVICVAGFFISRLTLKRGGTPVPPVKPDKRFIGLTVLAGTSTSVGNILIVSLTTRIPSVLLFPGLQGGVVILVSVISMLLLKERISGIGKLALVLGVVAIVLLS